MYVFQDLVAEFDGTKAQNTCNAFILVCVSTLYNLHIIKGLVVEFRKAITRRVSDATRGSRRQRQRRINA